MEIDKFADILCTRYNDNFLQVMFVVNHSFPTALQWTFFIEELKNLLEQLKKVETRFFFIFDVKKIGLISIDYIREFTFLMTKHSVLLESKLIANAAIAQGSIIKNIFEIINLLYKTKKPLSIVNDMDEALKFINTHIDLL
jgi:hypothetical protein